MNAGVGTGKRSDHQHTLGWNQILDGAASMVGNSQHVRHTPTVKMTDTSVSFVLPTSGKSGAIDEGIVVCNEEGKFVDTRARSPGDESACHSKPKSLNQVEGNPFIASATIWRTKPAPFAERIRSYSGHASSWIAKRCICHGTAHKSLLPRALACS
jgi:hypothetical protein